MSQYSETTLLGREYQDAAKVAARECNSPAVDSFAVGWLGMQAAEIEMQRRALVETVAELRNELREIIEG